MTYCQVFNRLKTKRVLPKTLSIALFSRPCCCCLPAERSLNYRTAVSYQRNSQKQPKKCWKYKKNKAWSKKGCGSTRAFKYPRPLNRGKERVTHLATGALGASHGHVSTHKVWKNRNLWTVLTTLPLKSTHCSQVSALILLFIPKWRHCLLGECCGAEPKGIAQLWHLRLLIKFCDMELGT